ncbi:hypothetical protein PCASD_00679 [Puccinia coronata f. sp. avenae]|uniref:Uncharacterized protein n=1 Tax=Puccinia coronata f. sp. avenae TaxID=200324 RepID=A0A2N5VKZ5_9BASI|nr:hypothetical protein PCASD_00679 [Puccinia coronata f. sp. avenae]
MPSNIQALSANLKKATRSGTPLGNSDQQQAENDSKDNAWRQDLLDGGKSTINHESEGQMGEKQGDQSTEQAAQKELEQVAIAKLIQAGSHPSDNIHVTGKQRKEQPRPTTDLQGAHATNSSTGTTHMMSKLVQKAMEAKIKGQKEQANLFYDM